MLEADFNYYAYCTVVQNYSNENLNKEREGKSLHL